MKKHILSLSSPASDFEHGAPLGGGSFGAMLLCSPYIEKIYLSEETIWSGEKVNTTDKSFRDKIDKARKMFLEGRLAEIDDWAKKNLEKDLLKIKSYEYAGVFSIDFEDKSEALDYHRNLNLNNGVAEISYSKNGNRIKETAFCSFPDEVTAVKIENEKKMSFSLSYFRENMLRTKYENNMFIAVSKTAYGNHRFVVGAKIITDGKTAYRDGRIYVSDACQTVLFINIETEINFSADYENICVDVLNEAENFEELKINHIEDFVSLFERSDVNFASPEEIEKLNTDERLERLKNDDDANDDGLASLYFAFGKYLLISSSRNGTLPANLQGVWAEKIENPWESDYHININLQMNYWFAENANMAECHFALFDYMNRYLLEPGKKTASENYKCRGTVVHHISDIYGFTAPTSGPWGMWPLGGAWLSFHMWEHYLFTKDKDFLRNTAYDYIHECALFFLDYMFEGKDGYMLSGPSISPENSYYPNSKKEKPVFLAFSPSMDTEIIGGLLRNYIEAENILNINPDDKKAAQNLLSKLPNLKIGKHGRLMEWLEDYEEYEPGHRHISHAFALYPDNAVTEKTPELLEGVRKTIEKRLTFGSGHTGWSRAWLINLFARLKDAESVKKQLRLLLTKSTLSNLLDVHPPFQIDGNFGGAAGIAEALLQSHEGYIFVLPAAGNVTGSFTRLKARGNIEVSAAFDNGKISEIVFLSPISQEIKFRVPASCANAYSGAEKLSSENGLYKIYLNENSETKITF